MATNVNNGLLTNQFTVDKLKAQKEANALAKASGTNPSAHLDKDAFMKLLLTELQYQDPTSPMDSEKMLTQTSQLATLETQENTNQMMKKLADQLKMSTSMYAVSALGKMANVGESIVVKTEKLGNVNFNAYFEKDAVSGTYTIKDKDGNVIRRQNFENAKAGVFGIDWDGKDSSGNEAKAGVYNVEISYTDKDGATHKSGTGTYPVEAIRFVEGEAQVKIAGQYINISDIKEFTEPKKG